jgi:hypothetical protein
MKIGDLVINGFSVTTSIKKILPLVKGVIHQVSQSAAEQMLLEVDALVEDVYIFHARISGLLTSFAKNSRAPLNSKEPTQIVDQLCVNSRCNRRLIPKTLVLVIDAKNEKYEFRTIWAKSNIVGATTDIWVASHFTTRQ